LPRKMRFDSPGRSPRKRGFHFRHDFSLDFTILARVETRKSHFDSGRTPQNTILTLAGMKGGTLISQQGRNYDIRRAIKYVICGDSRCPKIGLKFRVASETFRCRRTGVLGVSAAVNLEKYHRNCAKKAKGGYSPKTSRGPARDSAHAMS